MDSFRLFEAKKYMWDGEEHETESAARENFDKYKKDGFETQIVKEDDKFFIFSRRVVKEVVVEGEAL